MKYIFLLLIVLIVFVIWRKVKSKNETIQPTDVNEIDEPKVTFSPIVKDEILSELIENNSLYDFEISSVTKKQDTLDILISFINRSDKTVRIDLKQAVFSSKFSNQQLKADVTFYGELSMGTNDILLKNTILPDSQVIRNVYFFYTQLSQFHKNDALIIDVLINNELFQFTKYLSQSKLESVKIIE